MSVDLETAEAGKQGLAVENAGHATKVASLESKVELLEGEKKEVALKLSEVESQLQQAQSEVISHCVEENSILNSFLHPCTLRSH